MGLWIVVAGTDWESSAAFGPFESRELAEDFGDDMYGDDIGWSAIFVRDPTEEREQ